MDMNNTAFRAELIASLMAANGAAMDVGAKTRLEWAAEQRRLWTMAGNDGVAIRVMRLVTPSVDDEPEAVETDPAWTVEHDHECPCETCQMERAADTACESRRS